MSFDSLRRPDVLKTAKGPVNREQLRHLYGADGVRKSVEDILTKPQENSSLSTAEFLSQRSFEDAITEKQELRNVQTLDEFLLNIQEGTVVQLAYQQGGDRVQVFANSKVSRYVPGKGTVQLEERLHLSQQRYGELFEFLAACHEVTRASIGATTVIGFAHMTGKKIAIEIQNTEVESDVDFVEHFDRELAVYKGQLEASRGQYERLLRHAYTPDKKLRLGTIREVLETLRTTGVQVSKSLLREAYGKSLVEPMDAFFRLMSGFARNAEKTGTTWEHMKREIQRIFAKFPQLVRPLLVQITHVFFPKPVKEELPTKEAQLWAERMANREQDKPARTQFTQAKSHFKPVTERRLVRVAEGITEENVLHSDVQNVLETKNAQPAGSVVFLKRATESLDPTWVGLSQKELMRRRAERDEQTELSRQKNAVSTVEQLPQSKTKVLEKPMPAEQSIGIWNAPQEELFGGAKELVSSVKSGVDVMKGWGKKLGAFAKNIFSKTK